MQLLAQLRALISDKAFKCMRWSALAGLGLCLVLAAGTTRAEHGSAVLIAETDRGQISANAHFWHEKPGQITIEQASASSMAARFTPLQDEKMFDLRPQDRLWIRIDIEVKRASQDHVVLWAPLPLIDEITLYQPSEGGKWRALRAGDRVAVADWPEPGRYPRFHLNLPQGKFSVYLQVQGSTPVSIPLYIGSETQAQASDRSGFLGMGAVVGLLLTLMLMCFVTAYTYQDRLYLYYGVYMMLMISAVGAYTGVSAYLLWNNSPWWADSAQGVLALLSVGGALYFIEAIIGGRQYAHRPLAMLLGVAALSIPLAAAYALVPRSIGVIILGVYILSVSALGLSLAARAWRRGDRVGKWVLFAYAPLAMAVLLAVARAYGWIGVSWVVQYGVVVALLIEAPMMMVALHVRSRERHEITTREQAMATHDALTGLLKEHLFDYRVGQAVKRSIQRGEDAAIVLISLVNYDAIAQVHGSTVAEQSVLRSVIKLRRVLGDVEALARIGSARFGLILEGTSSRHRITEIGARIVAQGLMPLPGLVPDVTLQFHLVAACLRELPPVDKDIKAKLLDLLSSMSRRTRRPIRFLDGLMIDVAPTDGVIGAEPPSVLAEPLPSKQANVSTVIPVTDTPRSSSDWDLAEDADSTQPIEDTQQMPDTRP
jgi:two-component system, sensor histidine kinase LadS